MNLWVIVPVKPLKEGKSRLSGVLAGEKRAEFNRSLLENTLKTLSGVTEIERILVISRDPDVLAQALPPGIETLFENCPPELNASLDYATGHARQNGAGQVLVLPADLPLITPKDIRTFIQCGTGAEIVIAPDRHREGTNALLVCPPGAIPYCFGPGSFLRHRQEAEKRSLKVAICERPSFGLDIDLPEDLEQLKQIK
jgi:2-phospho-L-lactate/phosphoenolpyruvate guanylyltransferase